jgi:hypothetical protein
VHIAMRIATVRSQGAGLDADGAQALWSALQVSPPTTELVVPSEPNLSIQYSTMALMHTHARAESVAAYYATHHAVPATCLDNSCLTPRCAPPPHPKHSRAVSASDSVQTTAGLKHQH